MRPRIAIAVAVVLATAACGTTVEDPGSEPTAATSTANNATTAPYDDQALLRSLVALATHPGPETAAAVPFAGQVRLGLGPSVVATRPRGTLASIATWDVDLEAFRGYVGPFNALGLLAEHAADDGSLTGFATSVGDHPHCASPPTPAPDGLAGHRRLSLQPADATIDGCLEWFTVDLFLDDSGVIDAVTLDVWEP